MKKIILCFWIVNCFSDILKANTGGFLKPLRKEFPTFVQTVEKEAPLFIKVMDRQSLSKFQYFKKLALEKTVFSSIMFLTAKYTPSLFYYDNSHGGYKLLKQKGSFGKIFIILHFLDLIFIHYGISFSFFSPNCFQAIILNSAHFPNNFLNFRISLWDSKFKDLFFFCLSPFALNFFINTIIANLSSKLFETHNNNEDGIEIHEDEHEHEDMEGVNANGEDIEGVNANVNLFQNHNIINNRQITYKHNRYIRLFSDLSLGLIGILIEERYRLNNSGLFEEKIIKNLKKEKEIFLKELNLLIQENPQSLILQEIFLQASIFLADSNSTLKT